VICGIDGPGPAGYHPRPMMRHRAFPLALLCATLMLAQLLLPALQTRTMAARGMDPVAGLFCGTTSSPELRARLVAVAPPELLNAVQKDGTHSRDSDTSCCGGCGIGTSAGSLPAATLALIVAASHEFLRSRAAGLAPPERRSLRPPLRGPPLPLV